MVDHTQAVFQKENRTGTDRKQMQRQLSVWSWISFPLRAFVDAFLMQNMQNSEVSF